MRQDLWWCGLLQYILINFFKITKNRLLPVLVFAYFSLTGGGGGGGIIKSRVEGGPSKARIQFSYESYIIHLAVLSLGLKL